MVLLTLTTLFFIFPVHAGGMDETHTLKSGLPSEVRGQLKIFIFMGQSQISGRGEVTTRDRAINTNTNAFVFGNDYKWKIAMEPTDSAYNQRDRVSIDKSAGVGPAVAFTKEMNKLKPRWKVGIVQCAKGGTTIKIWKRKMGDSSLYGSCLNRALEASKSGEIVGIIFQQGETDTTKPGRKQVSPTNWKQLFEDIIADFRRDINIPDLPLVYTRIGNHAAPDKFVNWEQVKSQQAKAQIKNSAMVTTDDLSLQDYVHYTTDSFRMLGVKYANAFVKLSNINSNK